MTTDSREDRIAARHARMLELNRQGAEQVAARAAAAAAAAALVPAPPVSETTLRARSAKEHRGLEREKQHCLDRLAKLQELRGQLDDQMAEFIIRATDLGVTRVDIGRSLGMTRQAVQQRIRAYQERGHPTS